MNIARWLPSARSDFRAASAYREGGSRHAAEDIAALQLRTVAAVWADAVRDVPYYRDLAAAGDAPREIASWADFRAIPVLERATVRDNEHRFIRLSGKPDQFMQTAGSTGNPIRFGVRASEGRPQRIVKQAAWIEAGWTLGDEILLIWGHAHLLGTGWRGRVNHLKRKLKDRALGYYRANAYALGREDCLRIARHIVQARPAGIIGYAAALDLFGRHAAPLAAELRRAGVRFVIATAELPPRPDTLDMLKDLFGGCHIVEEFGGVEFGQVAVRFDNGSWRTFPELNILEAADGGDAEGESLLVTTLYPRYTPFVRYRQGDLVAEPTRLPHGALGGFGRLAGRQADMVVMPDGRSVHSVAFFHCLHQEPSILNIQMALTDAGPAIKLVVRDSADAQLECRVRVRLGQVHPALATAPLEYTADLATNAAGKRRWFVDLRTR
jgi:phenylacetate-CoA ligase